MDLVYPSKELLTLVPLGKLTPPGTLAIRDDAK